MTRSQFRSLDQHSGEHRPSKFFQALGSADEQLAELTVLRDRVRELETLLATARAERDSVAAVRRWEMGR
jgi:predicted nucleic acid-binding OB-fold protein